MATIGKINPCDDGLKDWDSYVERVDQYFTVNEYEMKRKCQQYKNLCITEKFVCTSKTWRAKLQ